MRNYPPAALVETGDGNELNADTLLKALAVLHASRAEPH